MFCLILQEDDCLAFDFDAAAVVKCYFHTDASYVDNSNPNADGVDQYVRVSVPCPDDATTGKYASLFEISKLTFIIKLSAFFFSHDHCRDMQCFFLLWNNSNVLLLFILFVNCDIFFDCLFCCIL